MGVQTHLYILDRKDDGEEVGTLWLVQHGTGMSPQLEVRQDHDRNGNQCSWQHLASCEGRPQVDNQQTGIDGHNPYL